MKTTRMCCMPVLAALSVACGGPGGEARRPSAAVPNPPPSVLYVAAGRLLSIQPDGSAAKEFDGLPNGITAASWAPDHRRIVFASQGDLYVVGADGGGLSRLTETQEKEDAPRWSPNGERIAFLRSGPSIPSTTDLFVMQADASGAINLTNSAGSEMTPAWSPDGQRLVFSRMEESGPRLYTIAASGGPATPLPDGAGLFLDADWSPDGQTILCTGWTARQKVTSLFITVPGYVYLMGPGYKMLGSAGPASLYKIAAGGGRPAILLEGQIKNSVWGAVWSPDGKHIALVSDRESAAEGTPAVYVMKADGSGLKRLSRPGLEAFAPEW